MKNEAGSQDPRRGPLARVAGTVYWYLVVEGSFLLAALPGFIGVLLLERSLSNIPLYALCLVPLAPAFSAAISAIAARDGELSVWPTYWRAYLRNVRDVLLLWVPALIAATVLGMNITLGGAAGVDSFFIGASIVLLAVLAVWSANVVLIASLFRFRTRDTARLALYYLAAKPLVTLGTVGYLLMGMAVVTFASDVVFALLGAFFAASALVVSRPMAADISARFVADETI